ncbi:hypothetical protein HMPREF1580_00708 [Gardnerella vaginalis JCP8070]|nr:hypothetical protein HMPREF1580_00708 [Gardnerella vaginalis JCP8070]EPI60010.1 hypothetical protein HMPREF1579_00634 [Gardnerella vaginalis JCP8066]
MLIMLNMLSAYKFKGSEYVIEIGAAKVFAYVKLRKIVLF